MKMLSVLAALTLMIPFLVIYSSNMAQAEEVLGTGTGSLLGGDLTDPEDDGDPEADKITTPFSHPAMNPGSRAENSRLTSLITYLAAVMQNGAEDLAEAFRRKAYT